VHKQKQKRFQSEALLGVKDLRHWGTLKKSVNCFLNQLKAAITGAKYDTIA